MKLTEIFNSTAILDGGPNVSKGEIIQQALMRLAEDGHILPADVPSIVEAMLLREQLGSTGIGRGVALPHAKHAGVSRLLGILVVCRAPVKFDSIDGEPASIFALMLFPPHRAGSYMSSRPNPDAVEVMRRLADETFLQRLRDAKTEREIVSVLSDPGVAKYE